ncbi:MAG: hypothetical protein IKL22_04445 [Lachnospiraceae bacterium]|nr:hypothetical protein [Lachnospiraceae bacterium]
MSRKKNDKRDDILNAGIAGASYETVQRYGSAVKEHLVAYSGIDSEKINSTTGKAVELQKSLKSIKTQGTNEEYAFSIRQQKAGWAAEVKDTANRNAEKIIKGESTRKIRHDDLPNTPANHPLYDHIEIDAQGNIVQGSGTQMKFIGGAEIDPTGAGNAERALKKLQSKDFQKYIDNDVKIEVPKDEYQQMIDKATEDISSLEAQLKKVKASGNVEAIEKLEKRIENLKKLKKNLRPSSLTRKEALEAVDSPKWSTTKSVAKVSHQAGLKTAGTAALIGGSASLIRNVVDMCKGEIEADEAAMNVLKDTAQTAAIGYGTGFAGSAIKGAMQHSKSQYTQALARTNVAGTIVAVTVSASKTLKKYFAGEIDGTECLESLGEQGTGMIASSMFAVIGQAVIPIPIVGGLIGGMVGYALSSATYGILTSSLKEAKLAHEERLAIEKACEEHIQMIREYRTQMSATIEKYLSDKMEVFNESFAGIKEALEIGDVDLFIESSNSIIDSLGGNKPFESMDEFNEKMLNGVSFKL